MIDVQVPPPIEMPPVEPLPVPEQFDVDEWRTEQDVADRLVDAEYQRLLKDPSLSGAEAGEQAVALLEQQKARESLRDLTDAGLLERVAEAIRPRAVAVGGDAGSELGRAMGVSAGRERAARELAYTLYTLMPQSQEATVRQAAQSGFEMYTGISSAPVLVTHGENQAEWFARLMSAPQIMAVELGLQATGALPEFVQAKLPLPEADPTKRGYDVPSNVGAGYKYAYTVLDKMRHGRAIEDDVFDATGHLPAYQRNLLYAGVMASTMLVNWEKPYVKIAGKVAEARQIGKFLQALEPDASMGQRVNNAVQGVLYALTGRGVDVPTS